MSEIEEREEWLKSLLRKIDQTIEPEIRNCFFEDCGRSCARRHVGDSLKKFKGDLEAFLAEMTTWSSIAGIVRDKNQLTITYKSCPCAILTGINGSLSKTFCSCSCGFLKETFESVLSAQVSVDLLESIRSGSSVCKFNVTLIRTP